MPEGVDPFHRQTGKLKSIRVDETASSSFSKPGCISARSINKANIGQFSAYLRFCRLSDQIVLFCKGHNRGDCALSIDFQNVNPLRSPDGDATARNEISLRN